MASRVRNGKRGLSIDHLLTLSREFKLPLRDVMTAARGGSIVLGTYVRVNIFLDDESVEAVA